MTTEMKIRRRNALFTLLTLMVLASKMNGELDKTVCTLPKTAVPPPMPVLTNSFSTSVEIKNLMKNETLFIQEDYDSNKNVISLTFKMVFTTVKMLLEMDHGQYVAVHENEDSTFPKSVCEVHLFTSPIIFYKDKPWLSSLKNLLDMMTQKSAVYKGTAMKRNMPVTHWTSCLYDNTRNMTLKADIYFRKINWIQSYSPMTTPVQLEIQGVIHNREKFHFVADYVAFLPFPKFPKDTFLTQSGVYCPGRNHLTGRNHPKIPDSFSLMFEIIDTDGKEISYQKIWFDTQKNISRIDTKDGNRDDSDPVTAIYDFNSGSKFTIDQFQETCYSELLQQGDKMVSYKDNKMTMMCPSEFLFLDTKIIQYTGQTTVRGVNCDIWVGIYYSVENGRNITVQWYFTADKVTDAVGTTLEQNVLLRMDKWEGESKTPVIYNTLYFNPSSVDWETFDIGRCYKTQNKSHFIAQFEAVLGKGLSNSKSGYRQPVICRMRFTKGKSDAATIQTVATSGLQSGPQTQGVNPTEVKQNDGTTPQISLDFWRNKLQEEIAARAKIETIRFSQTSLEYDGGILFYFVATLLDKLTHTTKSSTGNPKEHSLAGALFFLRGSIDGHWSVILPSLTGQLIELQGKAFRTLLYRDQFKATHLETEVPKLTVSTTYAIPPIIFTKKTTIAPPTKNIAHSTRTSVTEQTHLSSSKRFTTSTRKEHHSTKSKTKSLSSSFTPCICPTVSNLKQQTEKIVYIKNCSVYSSTSTRKSTVEIHKQRITSSVVSGLTKVTQQPPESTRLSHQQAERSPSTISPGEIAGVSIATFFVGVLVGCLSMIFYQNHQRRKNFEHDHLIELK